MDRFNEYPEEVVGRDLKKYNKSNVMHKRWKNNIDIVVLAIHHHILSSYWILDTICFIIQREALSDVKLLSAKKLE